MSDRKIRIWMFLAVLVLPGMIWYGVGCLAPEVREEWDFDLEENRAKAELPEFVLEKDCTQKLECYYNDNIPFRSFLITWEQKLNG